MKKLITTIAALALTVASYGQRTNSTYVDLFWGGVTQSLLEGSNSGEGFSPLFSEPSPTTIVQANTPGGYQVVGQDLQCSMGGAWVTISGISTYVWPGGTNGNITTTETITDATIGFETVRFAGQTGSNSWDTGNYKAFEENVGTTTKILRVFIGVPTYNNTLGDEKTISGIMAARTLTGCSTNYLVVTSTGNSLNVQVGTPLATTAVSLNPQISIASGFIDNPWFNLGIFGAFWSGGSVTATGSIMLNFDYTGTITPNSRYQISVMTKNPDGEAAYPYTLVAGSNSVSIPVLAANEIGDIRFRTSDAIGLVKFNAMIVGFSPTTSLGITGITTLSSGLIAKNAVLTLSGAAMPSSAFQGYTRFSLNDPNAVSSGLTNMNTLTGAVQFFMSGDGCVTLTGMAIENSSIKDTKVLCTVAPVVTVPNTTVGVSKSLSESNDVSVSPNPTTESVSVSSSVAVTGLKVYSLTGLEVTSSASSSVSLAGLASGTYIMEIATVNGIIRKKIIKL
ncbi:MAG: T9SS C-terminal target domain-containing protein [Bacteroidetes bacterium]|nr:MAG: T9SS C-terminal target domain-containing protein [Bacteroidota bacterium]